MGVIAVYRRVLGNGALARVLFGEFVSSIGDWLYLVALLVLIWNETRDPVILGIVGAARIVPYILLSVPAGIVADHYDRRLVLLVTDVVRGVIMVGIAAAVVVDAPIWLIVVLAITATCFSAFFSPAIGAFLPSLVRDESELGPANSAWSSLENLAFFVGPAIAALLLSIGSIALAFLLNALTFAVVAVVLLRLPMGRPIQAPATGSDGDEQPARASSSLRAVLQPVFRPLVGLSVLNIVSDFIFGGLSVITVILAVDVFRVDEATGTGLLNSAIGVGGIVGALVAGALVLRRRLAPPLLIGAGGLALGLVVLGEAPADVFSVALVAMAVTAAGALLVQIVNTTLLQRIVPDAVRGRTLGGMETLSITAYAAGSFVMPLLAANEPAAVLVASAVVVALAAVFSVVLIGQHSIQRPADDDRRRLADIPILAGLPPARLEAAMMRATVRQMRRGERIIGQGDEADFFYVIVEGTVEVTQTDTEGQERVLREMKSGDFFGEIGLLSRVPRTASVTALTEGELIALDKQTFLDLVEGGPGLTYRLLDLHRGAISGVGETVPASQPASR
jgi:MFS family permease